MDRAKGGKDWGWKVGLDGMVESGGGKMEKIVLQQ